ncbi:MAG TPA: pentapeptide repeat-containing protein [Candidatus Binatia bacterium]|nr:pentapeptide repeat-containing protein [Candidatus Binatia bacterium]
MAGRLRHLIRDQLARLRWPLAALTALVMVLACVPFVPQWLVRWELGAQARTLTAADKANAINDVRTTLLQGIGGAVILLGVYFTYRQLQTSREGQITERFSRAIDHLGNDKEDVRLGGIYTLERIAKDSPEDRRTIQAVLGSYVRTHAPWLVGSSKGPQHPTPTVDRQLPWLQRRTPDVQTAMVVLGRRPRYRDELQLNLARVDLRGAFLYNARLSNTLFRHSNLARAQMLGVQLDGADLEDVDLRQANLQRARLTGANLRNAHLQDADLRGADLRSVNLEGANLHGAQLENAHADPKTIWPEGFKPGSAGVLIDGSGDTAGGPES